MKKTRSLKYIMFNMVIMCGVTVEWTYASAHLFHPYEGPPKKSTSEISTWHNETHRYFPKAFQEAPRTFSRNTAPQPQPQSNAQTPYPSHGSLNITIQNVVSVPLAIPVSGGAPTRAFMPPQPSYQSPSDGITPTASCGVMFSDQKTQQQQHKVLIQLNETLEELKKNAYSLYFKQDGQKTIEKSLTLLKEINAVFESQLPPSTNVQSHSGHMPQNDQRAQPVVTTDPEENTQQDRISIRNLMD